MHTTEFLRVGEISNRDNTTKKEREQNMIERGRKRERGREKSQNKILKIKKSRNNKQAYW